VNSSLICYNGPNLANSGVTTGDDLNVVLGKLDDELDPVVLVQTIIQILQTNPALKVVFCEIVNECLAP